MKLYLNVKRPPCFSPKPPQRAGHNGVKEGLPPIMRAECQGAVLVATFSGTPQDPLLLSGSSSRPESFLHWRVHTQPCIISLPVDICWAFPSRMGAQDLSLGGLTWFKLSSSYRP